MNNGSKNFELKTRKGRPVKIEGEELEEVERFTYLGSLSARPVAQTKYQSQNEPLQCLSHYGVPLF